MDFIRNKEVKRQIVVSSILILFWGGIGIIVDSKAVWIVLSAIISSSAVSLFFTYQRYKKIADFSLHIDRLLHGDETISFGQFQEGELSVLHDEISKMTRRLIEQAEALKMEKGNLANALADISHQLKTPLTSLNILNASLCNEELTDEERYELIRKQTMLLSRMEWLIATLLKISKLDAGTITLKPQAVYLKDVVEKAIRPLEIAAELKMQTITQVIPAELKLALDADWTAEALGNVIKNCIEHSPESSSIEIKAIERPLLTQIIMEQVFGKRIYRIYLTDFIKEVALQSVMPVWGWLWQKQSSSIRAASSRRKTGSQAVQNLKSAFIGGLLNAAPF